MASSEESLDAELIAVGDAVTVECRDAGARLIAIKVTVADVQP